MHDPRSRPGSITDQPQSGFEPRTFDPFVSRQEIVECLIQEIQEGAFLRPAQILKEFGKDALQAVPAFEQLLRSRYMDDFAHDQMCFAVERSSLHDDIVQAVHPAELFAEVLMSIAGEDHSALEGVLPGILLSDNRYLTRAGAFVLAKSPVLVNSYQLEFIRCLDKFLCLEKYDTYQETTLWYLSRAIKDFASPNNYLSELIFQLSARENLLPEISQNLNAALSRWTRHSGSFIFDSLRAKLNSDSVEMQATALRIVAELGPDAESLAEQVQLLLSHVNPAIQLLAVQAFGSMGALRYYGADPATVALYEQAILKLKNFTDESHSLDLRQAALLALGYCAEPVAELREFFRHRMQQYHSAAQKDSAALQLYRTTLEGLRILEDMQGVDPLTTRNS